MKKSIILKSLFAAAALAFALPGCNGLLDSSESESALVTKDGKIAVNLTSSEAYRTIISALPENLAYTLSVTDADGNAAGSLELESLTESSAVIYLEAGSYTFTLTGSDADGKAIVSGSTKKTISADDATVAITLTAVTGESVNVALSLAIAKADDYGVSAVEALVYEDAALTLAASDSLAAEKADDGSWSLKGTLTSGADRWVKISLKDSSGTQVGSKTEQLFAIAGSAITASTSVQVKQYKATVTITTTETTAPAVTLSNANVSGAAVITMETASAASPYTYTAYVPVGSYTASAGEKEIGHVTGVEPVSVNTSVTLSSISAAWTDGSQPLIYAAESAEDSDVEAKVKAALTVTATLSSGEETVSNYTLSGLDVTASGDQNVTVSYTYNGKTETAAISVNLTAVALENITIKTEPTTTEYTVGDSLDLTGLVLTLTYNNGKSEEVAYSEEKASDFETSGFDSTAAVTSQPVTVTYGGKSATFEVVIKSAVISVYELSGESATISLGKTQVGTIKDTANNETNQYLSVATDNWNSESTIGEYTDAWYNLSGASRYMTLKVKNVAAFKVYVKNSTAGRTFTVKIGSGDAETITHPGKQTIDGTETDVIPFLFNTGTNDEVSIVIGGGSSSVYPAYVTLYSTAQTIPAESVTITGAPTEAVLLATGSVQLGATVSPARATETTVTWTSGDETIATVDSTGKVTFVKDGTVTITAAVSESVKAEAEITIQAEAVKVSSIVVKDSNDATSSTINAGDSLTLTATVSPDDASNKAVTWTSSNEEAAKVADGVVTAVGAGTATITATAADGSGVTGTYEVNVKSVLTATYFANWDKDTTLTLAPVVSDGLGTVTDVTVNKTLGSITAEPAVGEAKSGKGYGLVVTTTETIAASTASGSEIWSVTFTVTPVQDVTLTKIIADSVCNKTSNYTLSFYNGDTVLKSVAGSSNAASIDETVSVDLSSGTSYTFKVAFETKGKDIKAGPFSLSNVGLTFAPKN